MSTPENTPLVNQDTQPKNTFWKNARDGLHYLGWTAGLVALAFPPAAPVAAFCLGAAATIDAAELVTCDIPELCQDVRRYQNAPDGEQKNAAKAKLWSSTIQVGAKTALTIGGATTGASKLIGETASTALRWAGPISTATGFALETVQTTATPGTKFDLGKATAQGVTGECSLLGGIARNVTASDSEVGIAVPATLYCVSAITSAGLTAQSFWKAATDTSPCCSSTSASVSQQV